MTEPLLDAVRAAHAQAGERRRRAAADDVAVPDRALEQIPAERVEQIEILVGADRTGATHELAAARVRCGLSLGYDLTDTVRHAIRRTPHATTAAEHTFITTRSAHRITHVTSPRRHTERRRHDPG